MSEVGRTLSPPLWALRHEWPVETLVMDQPRAEQWCEPTKTFDCQGESACRDCGNDLDTLCPLLALPGLIALGSMFGGTP